MAAGELVDLDPERAYQHAAAARQMAARLPIVREAAAETAYASGRYDIALREFRAIRRMNGGEELVPVMADCERALGRHREALKLLEEISPQADVALKIEALLVEAGVRDDLGQRDEAIRLLKAAISRRVGPRMEQARLRYAYANLLELRGDAVSAREWFESANKLDPEGELDTADRLASLDGISLPEDMSFDEELEEDEAVDAGDGPDAEFSDEDETDEDDESEFPVAEPDDVSEIAEPSGADEEESRELSDLGDDLGDLDDDEAIAGAEPTLEADAEPVIDMDEDADGDASADVESDDAEQPELFAVDEEDAK